ncbi:MAG: histidine--tRNA ligase [Gemmatimonadota bacterium]
MPKARNLAKLPGFRDFHPEELAFLNFLFESWRRVSRRYGFLEYDGPPLEPLELYTQKSGDEIVGQLYDFVDKGDRHVALRPEMTPSLARILGERSKALPKPIRWFSVPQLFRYERQQRGRLREHFQWNVDLVGEEGVEADAEVLAVALAGLRELGLGPSDVRARVSDRVLLSAVLESAGVPPEALGRAFAVVDKIEREPADRTLARLRDPAEVGVTEGEARRILDLFAAPGLDAVAAAFSGSTAVVERAGEVWRFLAILDDLGFAEYVEFDLSIVRGLAYYTGIVFEIFDRKGEFRAICGGGRYDRLLELVGGDPLPAVGFGMGDVVVGEILHERGLAPPYARHTDYFIVSVDEAQAPLARKIGGALRAEGHTVLYPLKNQSVRKQFSAAATEGAREVIILGPEEVGRGVAVIRNMESGGEREVALRQLEEAKPGG